MKRYSIMVRELGRDTERVACEVDRDPHPIARALYLKRAGRGKDRSRMYSTIRIRDNALNRVTEVVS